MNQQENIKSKEQNRQNTRLGSQKEKGEILNQNNQLTERKTYRKICLKRELTSDNFMKRSNQNIAQNKHPSGSKFYQSNIQNKIENRHLTININKNKSLDIFTIKDIQIENKEITKIFQKEALNYIAEDEEIENKNIARFLIQVAHASRRAYNNSYQLFINMFKEFSKIIEEEKDISTLKNDEQLRKEFSSWLKEYEKTPEGKKKYENYFNLFKAKGRYAKEDYISSLRSQLTRLYFHCELSFPIVDVDFNLNSEIIFNHEKMIDFINKGNNRKVNFIILPSLFSNGNYLENGKFWVFTYKKDTFKFGKLRFENLVNKQEKYNANYSNNSIPNSQYNNRDINSLRKQTNYSSNSNTNYYPREREVKYYKHYIDKTKNKLMIIKK